MPAQRKIDAVNELEARLRANQVIVATGFRGLSGGQMTQLRRELRAKGVQYRVVKNNLARRAAEAAGKGALAQLLDGPTALALAEGDVSVAPKALGDFIRTSRLPLRIVGGLLDGRLLDPKGVEMLAALPRPEVAMAQLLAMLQSPLAGLAGGLEGLLQNLLQVLQARRDQLEGAGSAPVAAP